MKLDGKFRKVMKLTYFFLMFECNFAGNLYIYFEKNNIIDMKIKFFFCSHH